MRLANKRFSKGFYGKNKAFNKGLAIMYQEQDELLSNTFYKNIINFLERAGKVVDINLNVIARLKHPPQGYQGFHTCQDG